LVTMTTAVKLPISMASVRPKAAMIRVVGEAMNAAPTVISAVRERETVILMMTALET